MTSAERIAVAFIVLVAFAASARAERRVLLVQFQGERVRAYYRLVKNHIEEHEIKVLANAEANASVGTETPPAVLAEFFEELEVDAIITGAVVRKRQRRFFLKLVLYADGERTRKRVFLGRRRQLNRRVKARIEKEVSALLEEVPDRPEEPYPEREGDSVVSGDEVLSGEAEPGETGAEEAKEAPEAEWGKEKPKGTPWRNFAPFRPILTGNRMYLRSYYDTRRLAALEGLIRVRTPGDFVVVARQTVLRDVSGDGDSEMSDQPTIDNFGLLAVYSPAVYGVGGVAHVGDPLGSGTDAVRLGLTHTASVKVGGWGNLYFLTMFMPYNSTRSGGMALSGLYFIVNPVRVAMITAAKWPGITQLDDTKLVYLRPYVGAQLWHGLGLFAQYESNSSRSLPEPVAGLRLGVEWRTSF